MLELVALTSDVEAAADAALAVGGTWYRAQEREPDGLPYTAMIRAATDRPEPLVDVADVGLYTCFARTIKAPNGPTPPERVVASFGLVRRPDRSHREVDDHWRDVHGPLALRHHAAMCDYVQLSVVARHSGLELDGIALCAFDNRTDLRERFFNDDEAKAEIIADVASFADPGGSPRRVVLVEQG